MRFKVLGLGPPWPPAPLPARRAYRPEGRAYASESATGCVYEIIFVFYGIWFPSPHLGLLGLGQGFWVQGSGFPVQGQMKISGFWCQISGRINWSIGVVEWWRPEGVRCQDGWNGVLE